MNRLDGLAENSLVARVKRLMALSNELKSAQRFGSGSVRTSRVFSGNASDFQATSIGFNNRVIEVTFTPADTTVGNTSLAYKMDFTYTTVGGSIDVITERLVPSGPEQKWRLYLEGSDVSPVTSADFKFYFYTNGGGSFTAQLV